MFLGTLIDRNILTKLCYLVHCNWTEMIKHQMAKWDDYTNEMHNIRDNITGIISTINKMINIRL